MLPVWTESVLAAVLTAGLSTAALAATTPTAGAAAATKTTAASDSAARAKAKAAPTAPKPATTTPAPGTRTTLATPTTKTQATPARPTTSTPVRPTVARTAPAQTSTTTRPTPTVAKVAPAPTTPGTKPGARTTIARLGPVRPTTTAPATPVQAKPVGPRAAGIAKVTGGAAATAAVAGGGARQNPQGPAGSVKPIARSNATKAGATVSKAATTKPPGRKATGALAAAVPLDDHVTYQYNALGRRDVFTSLIDGEFVGIDQGGGAPPDVGGVKLVGIVWGSDDQFAMVEDARGDSYVLRRGDKVMNGFVEGLKRDAMIVNMTVDGQTQSVTIPVTRKGEKSNANR